MNWTRETAARLVLVSMVASFVAFIAFARLRWEDPLAMFVGCYALWLTAAFLGLVYSMTDMTEEDP